jgi:hypothetical protein
MCYGYTLPSAIMAGPECLHESASDVRGRSYVPKMNGLPYTPLFAMDIQKGMGNPLRLFNSVTLLGIIEIASLISSMVILSHSSSIALRNSVGSRISPRFFSLCLIVLQIVSMGLRSGDSEGFDSHWMPNRLFACLGLLSALPRVPWLLSLSSKSIQFGFQFGATTPSKITT